ncbi:MAG: molybdopterin-dependent oxidoreductase [Dehalococcoidia bacterium]|nr:molybdopterin-dependent oxidoreductase [Dehalococcoidia bacterium]
MAQELKVVGKSPPRLEGVEKATGRAVYGQDLRRSGMLIGKVLRSRFPHANILSIDTREAEALPGVMALLTAKDVPPGLQGLMVKDENVLAVDRVRFLGEAVAAVAAIDGDTAQRALGLIKVVYQELPAVFDPEEAMAEDAPILHPDLGSYRAGKMVKGTGNTCIHVSICKGDVEDGFRKADHVLEDTFRTQMVLHAYMEPHAALAEVDERGRITIWTTTQGPFSVRAHMTEIFHLPMSMVRVIGVRCGGGFGGKTRSLVAPIAVLLAMKSHRPVKVALSMDEDFISSHPRHPSVVRIKSGVMKDGTLLARQATVIMDTGAYADFGPVATSGATTYALGPYRIPHVKSDGYCVYTNKTSCGALRAPGAVQAAFAVESHMDKIAHRLGMDPMELRLKNAVQEGDLSHTGQVYGRIGLRGTLEAIKNYLKRQGPPVPGRAWGVACGQWGIGGASSSAQVKINEDGTAVLLTGAMDLGTGSDTVLCQIAAEELGLRLEDMSIVTADTDATPYDMASVGNRITFTAGNAVRRAAADAREQLLEMAGELLEASPRDLEAVDRRVCVKGSPDRAVPIAQLAAMSHGKGGPILGRGSYAPTSPAYDPTTARGHAYPSRPGDSFCAQAAEVEVQPETGAIKVLRVVAAHDLGRAINPQMAEAQVEGSLGFGLGFALREEVKFERGKTMNPHLTDYRLSTAMDMPPIDIIMMEEAKGEGPYGALGLAETPNIPSAAAVANAIFNAAGIRLNELPVTPEKVRAALREAGR